ncbi:MAG: efflux RND transporter periplasmic adaptor subunit [Planctomycetaceae bacterium]|nr:efflux RND transporter periplasmic adaptor subunit [Planctomycetaceae bacterium]
MTPRWSAAARVTAVLAMLHASASLATAQAPGPARVIAAPVVAKTMGRGSTFVGTIVPVRRSAVGSAVDGRVVEFPIDTGDRVAAGQAICMLLTETIRLQIEAAEADLRLRNAELEELRNGSRPEEIAQAQARLESADARRRYTESRYRRAKALHEQGRTLTVEQFEETLSAHEVAQQTYLEAQHELELLEKGPRVEQIAQAVARQDAQRAQVQQLRDQLRKHSMIAPFDGYVVREGTERGEWVTRGQVVAEIVALDEVDIDTFVVEDQVTHVKLGERVRVEVPALGKAEALLGHVVQIPAEGDSRSRTYPVKVRLTNTITPDGPLLKGGMLARVTLPTGPVQETLLVPKDALVISPGATRVFVVGPPQAPAAVGGPKSPAASSAAAGQPPALVARAIPVVVSDAAASWIAVSGDLKAGDQVVVVGNERLRPMGEQPVEIIQTWPIPEDLRDAAPESTGNPAQ